MSIIVGRQHRLLHVRTLLAKRDRGEQEIRSIHNGSLLYSQLLHKERTTPQTPLREEVTRQRILHRPFTQEVPKKNVLGLHDRFIRDEKFRKNMFDTGQTEEICRQMDDLADENHTHHLTREEIRDYRVYFLGFVRTKLVPIQCQSGTNLTSKKHCLPCDSSMTKKMQLITIKNGRKAFLRLGGTARFLVAFFL